MTTSTEIDLKKIRQAFDLGWNVYELRNRVLTRASNGEYLVTAQKNLLTPTTKTADFVQLVGSTNTLLRVSSAWRRLFACIANDHSILAELGIVGFPTGAAPKVPVQPAAELAHNGATALTAQVEAVRQQATYLEEFGNEGMPIHKRGEKPILQEFPLYELTRRALNCLTFLYMDPQQSLIPEIAQRRQQELIAAIQKTNEGARVEETPEPEPTGVTAEASGSPLGQSEEEQAVEAALYSLTNLVVRQLDEWDNFLRDTLNAYGVEADDQTMLVAYDAGRGLAGISWRVTTDLIGLEKPVQEAKPQGTVGEKSAASPDGAGAFAKKWKSAFMADDIVRVQHQLTSLRQVMDKAYRAEQVQEGKDIPAGDRFDPELPGAAIQSICTSLDHWQRTVARMASDPTFFALSARSPVHTESTTGFGSQSSSAPLQSNPRAGTGAPASNIKRQESQPTEIDPELWKSLRVALIEQANVWQSLMNGERWLKDYPAQGIALGFLTRTVNEVRAFGAGEANQELQKILLEAKAAAQQLFDLTNELRSDATRQAQAIAHVVQERAAGVFSNVRPYLVAGAAFMIVTVVALFLLLFASQANSTAVTTFATMSSFAATVLGLLGINGARRQGATTQTLTDMIGAQLSDWIKGFQGQTQELQNAVSDKVQSVATWAQGVEEGAITTVRDILATSAAQVEDTMHRMNYSVGVSYPLIDWYIRYVSHDRQGEAIEFVHTVLWTNAEAENLRAQFQQQTANGIYAGWRMLMGESQSRKSAISLPQTATEVQNRQA